MSSVASALEGDDRSRPVPPATERAFVTFVQWTALAFAPVLGAGPGPPTARAAMAHRPPNRGVGRRSTTPRQASAVVELPSDRLAAVDERASQVVQYRFYSGLTLDETAAVLGVSAKTVQRDWLSARAWLRKEVIADLRL